MDVVIKPDGSVHCIYGETLPLARLGKLHITRASHVEPGADGKWVADLSPVGGPTLGPFDLRSSALVAEVDWLKTNWLNDLSIP